MQKVMGLPELTAPKTQMTKRLMKKDTNSAMAREREYIISEWSRT